MKINILLFILFSATLISCSGLSGTYSQINIGYLGMSNSVSSYELDMFGSVEYSLSTSGSRSSNSYSSHNGKYKVEGNNIIMNFGGSDRILRVSEDKTTLTDDQGNIYKKR